ncbi:MAG: Flp family type IVb pilin [bacterium]|nr:Flp family type IVb pilin [bacterium]
MSLKDRLVLWLWGEEGAAVTEYALLLALVVLLLITTLTSLGTELQKKLSEIITRLSGISP